MYLHLGQNVIVPEVAVVGVFDLDNTTGSRATRNYLSHAEKSGYVVSVSDELPKSFVVCNLKGKTEIYLSQLSSQTLLKRSGVAWFDC